MTGGEFSIDSGLKLFLSMVVLVADAVVAVPTQCYDCDGSNPVTCTDKQTNRTCATHRNSLGTTHCGSVAIEYRDLRNNVNRTGFIRGCFDCADKREACAALAGKFKGSVFRPRTLLRCEIECCNETNCNTHIPTLSQNAITFLIQNASGPTQCQECFASDSQSCTVRQKPEICDTEKSSLGTTHCATAKIKFLDIFRKPFNKVIRRCIYCADKKEACAVIRGYLSSSRSWTLLECDIECCTGNNCNDGVDADGPTQCNACIDQPSTSSCSATQRNQTCYTDLDSLGTTHCGSAKLKYLDSSQRDVKSGLFRGCVDCEDKKAACFAIGGYLKASKTQTLLQCEIKCCNKSNCNTLDPDLSQDVIAVFTPDADGPSQCQTCFESDAATCNKRQIPKMCAKDPQSLGTTHCSSATIKYREYGKVRVGLIRGCIDCADKKAACAAITGYLKVKEPHWTLLECGIECCSGNNCNDKGADLPTCNYCSENDAASCSRNERPEICALDPNSLGTTHCGTAVGKYLDSSGNEQNLFYRGCFDCADKKAACFALGGFFKGDKFNAGKVTLLQCQINCCTEDKCNTQVPTPSNNTVTVFTPAASGPTQCNSCLENNATSCSGNQKPQICAKDAFSLGTTHCGSAVGKYRDLNGNVVDGFLRGCINCADKKAACAAVSGYLKSFRKWTQLECEIDCCTGESCNTNQSPTLPRGGTPTRDTKPSTGASYGLEGHRVLSSGILFFLTAFADILYLK